MAPSPWRCRKCKHVLAHATDGLYELPPARVSWQYPSLRVRCPNCGAENEWWWRPSTWRPRPEGPG